MAIYDVAIVRPHRFLAGKAHELHLGTDGEDCNNGWYGVASLSSVADDIYAALSKIVLEPKLIVSREFMMSIFDRLLKKEIDGRTNPTYLPLFDQWWRATYVEGRKTRNRKCGKMKGEFMMPKVLKLCFEPDDDDAEKCRDIVVDLGWVGCRRWKTEMTSKKAGKRTHEHVTAAGGVRSDRAMTMEENLASKK